MRNSEFTKDNTISYLDYSHYVRPNKAYQKMKKGLEQGKNIYIRAVSTYGKTSLIQSSFQNQDNFFYFSAPCITESSFQQISVNKPLIVIDDLQNISSEDTFSDIHLAINHLLLARKGQVILISRGKVPRWLYNTYIRLPFLTISEEDLSLQYNEIRELFSSWNISLTKKMADWIIERGQGNAMAYALTAEHMAQGEGLTNQLLCKVEMEVWDWLENHVYENWEPEMQEFLMKLSVVDTFNISMAKMITGRSDAEDMLRQAKELGNFLLEEFEEDYDPHKQPVVTYYFLPHMLFSMRHYMQIKFTEKQRNVLYTNVGLYFEMNNQPTEALELYSMAGESDRISSLLIDNARKNPQAGYLYELRKYYFALPETEIQTNAQLMSGMCMLQSILLNIEESERWYQILSRYAQKESGIRKREAENILTYLDIALPHRGSKEIIALIKHAWNCLSSRQLHLPEMAVTSNLPSLMNGGKDFCDWSKQDQFLAKTIGKMLQTVLGKYGKGLIELALAESYLEKGEDSFEIIPLIEKGRMKADCGGKQELVFVAEGLRTWLCLYEGKLKDAQEVLRTFQMKAASHPKMIPNVITFLQRLNLYNGEIQAPLQWLDSAPDENLDFYVADRFHYLLKIRIYIATGRLSEAMALIQKLLYYAKVMSRHYIRIECKVLLSIVLYRLHRKDWDETFTECLAEAEEYKFSRIISKEGSAVAPLLQNTSWIARNQNYKKQLYSEVKQMVNLYPSYLKESSPEIKFSENQIMILKLLAEGFSISQIAEQIYIQPDTVKYHNKQIYQKLGVKNKTSAVMEARRLGLI